MPRLRFRVPGHALSVAECLARALPAADPAARERLRGALRVRRIAAGGERPGAPAPDPVPPGTALLLDVPDGAVPIARAAPAARTAQAPSSDRAAPHAPADRGAPSPELRILLPALPWTRGELHLAGRAWTFAQEEERAGVAALRLRAADAACGPPPLDAVLDWAASAGAPVLGDVHRGGVLVAGGLRVAAGSADALWPAEPVFAPDATDANPRAGALAVSVATVRALHRGHPWVIADAETGDPAAFRPGALVRLVPPRGPALGLARTDGEAGVAARVWALGAARARGAASVEERVARALERRAALLAGAGAAQGTDAVRLVHGEADGLPGLVVERLGPLVRVVVASRTALPVRDRALAALQRALAGALPDGAPFVEVLHLRMPPPGRLESVRLLAGAWPPPGADRADGRVAVREGRLRFWVDPGLGAPERPRSATGLFLDQRDNRARVAARAKPGGRYLNLFAHTGGFSAALLAAGAGLVVSVDLSAPYLAWLEANLALTGLPLARHRAVKRDVRRALAELAPGERFDGIVLDPPTAAAAGQRFWSVRRDLPDGVGACLARLAPGGWLLVSRNDRRARGRLAERVRAAAAEAGVALTSLEPAAPGADFPPLPGFPEGDPFEALLATVA
jgi:23S rRNA (cytosine1962-C5)-methyltransferase